MEVRRTARHIGGALSLLLFGFILGLAYPRHSPEDVVHPRRLGEVGQTVCSCSCPLEAMLRIEPDVARNISADIAKYAAGTLLTRLPPLLKHTTSKTALVDAFVRLHGLMHAMKLLPVSEWGVQRSYASQTNLSTARGWVRRATLVGRGKGHAGPSALPRLALNMFLLQQADAGLVPLGSRCLGWDSVEYLRILPGCADRWSFKFTVGVPRLDQKRMILYSDLSTPSAAHPAQGMFDVVLCNQVFEHVSRPVAGAKALYSMLRPGGLLLFTAPFNEHFHLIPGDFFRYTFDGARVLLSDAGFEILQAQKWGDTLIASGALLGFGVADFEPAYLEAKLLQPVDHARKFATKKEWLYFNIAIIARRPKHGHGHRTAKLRLRQPLANRSL